MLKTVLLIHFLISVGISGIGLLIKRDWYLAMTTLGINIFYPIGGYCITILIFLKRDRVRKHIEEDEFEEEIFLFTDHKSAQSVEHIVPLEETLLVNTNEMKRERIIHILKEDPLQYIQALKLALKDRDTETSHYASSAISEIKRKLNLELQKFSVYYDTKRDDEAFLKDYLKVVQTYLESGLLDRQSFMRYSTLYFELLTKLVEQCPNREYYEALSIAYLKDHQYDKARQCSEAFLAFDRCEESFRVKLQYYFVIKDKTGFLKTLEELRQSKVSLSHEGLRLIRFWMEESDGL